MLPRAPRFKRPLHRCNACDPKSGSQWSCSTSCDCSSVRFPTGGGALVRFDFQKVAAPDGFAPSTSRVRAGRSSCLSYRAIRSANRSCTGLSPIPAACVATNALAELKWSGISGRMVRGSIACRKCCPRVSRRSERRGLLSSSCPTRVSSKWWSHGESHPDLRNAIASSCCWTMAPKWSARPDSHRVRAGLQAAASTISASRAFVKWGDRRDSHPDLLVHSQKL